jgi:hypothetical protein
MVRRGVPRPVRHRCAQRGNRRRGCAQSACGCVHNPMARRESATLADVPSVYRGSAAVVWSRRSWNCLNAARVEWLAWRAARTPTPLRGRPCGVARRCAASFLLAPRSGLRPPRRPPAHPAEACAELRREGKSERASRTAMSRLEARNMCDSTQRCRRIESTRRANRPDFTCRKRFAGKPSVARALPRSASRRSQWSELAPEADTVALLGGRRGQAAALPYDTGQGAGRRTGELR